MVEEIKPTPEGAEDWHPRTKEALYKQAGEKFGLTPDRTDQVLAMGPQIDKMEADIAEEYAKFEEDPQRQSVMTPEELAKAKAQLDKLHVK